MRKVGTAFIIFLLLTACVPQLGGGEQPVFPDGFKLMFQHAQAARGETVRATVEGVDFRAPVVELRSLRSEETSRAQVISLDKNSVVYAVPLDIPEGEALVTIREDDKVALGEQRIVGRVEPDRAVAVFEPDVEREEALAYLKSLSFSPTSIRPLGGRFGACTGDLALVDLNGRPLQEALRDLRQSELVYGADPDENWGGDTVVDAATYLGITGADRAQANGRTGAGVTIAVLDTGVSANPELSGRMLPGYNFVHRNTTVTDDYGSGSTAPPPLGHGTAIAVMAAGSKSGVAPETLVMPVKVCDQDGLCLVSDVVEGVCYAVSRAPDGPGKLVLNLSLGGSVAEDVLEGILREAIENQNVLVATAAGNQGETGSPPHYPAAYAIEGLVAVAALSDNDGSWVPSSFSTRGTYVDVAAPGDLIVLDSTGVTYSGTSFSTGIGSGALALWRQMFPGWASAQVELGLEGAASSLPFAPDEVGKGLIALDVQP